MAEQENFDEINDIRICKKISRDLCGEIVEIAKNYAVVKFSPSDNMIADDNMIIHYGFIFNSASFCALSAINEPNSIIIYSEVKFLSPLELGNEVTFKAIALHSDLKKREVNVEGFLYNIKIFEAIFHIVVFEKSMFKIDFSNVK